ncbi:hypothetical protein [Polymorphobacter sp.]|uniref:hypothetical protein n=1 Tax=Polymorphobacter sp. TaxID=1909290 RepID=UPI003F7182B1
MNEPFDPVPVRARHDGWTPARQHEFIMRLADTGSVTEAAEAVGMTVQTAYRLRRHPDATQFREAWDRAVEQAGAQLEQAALARALHGERESRFQHGLEVEARVRPCSDRLLIYMLERHERQRHLRAWSARRSFPTAPDFETAELTGLAMQAEALPDAPGLEGEELLPTDFAARHHAPRQITPSETTPPD